MEINHFLIERFNEKINKTETCWLWTGATKTNGYGNFGLNNKSFGAHVMAVLLDGRDVPQGYEVMHKCDNPACVNPEHLVVASHKENMADASRKGRMVRGERHQFAKANDEMVRQIRAKAAQGIKQAALAKEYGIHQTTVGKIVLNKIWKHVV